MCVYGRQDLFQEIAKLITVELRVAPEMVDMGRSLQVTRPHYPPSLPLLFDKSLNGFYWYNLVRSAVNIKLRA